MMRETEPSAMEQTAASQPVRTYSPLRDDQLQETRRLAERNGFSKYPKRRREACKQMTHSAFDIVGLCLSLVHEAER